MRLSKQTILMSLLLFLILVLKNLCYGCTNTLRSFMGDPNAVVLKVLYLCKRSLVLINETDIIKTCKKCDVFLVVIF